MEIFLKVLHRRSCFLNWNPQRTLRVRRESSRAASPSYEFAAVQHARLSVECTGIPAMPCGICVLEKSLVAVKKISAAVQRCQSKYGICLQAQGLQQVSYRSMSGQMRRSVHKNLFMCIGCRSEIFFKKTRAFQGKKSFVSIKNVGNIIILCIFI